MISIANLFTPFQLHPLFYATIVFILGIALQFSALSSFIAGLVIIGSIILGGVIGALKPQLINYTLLIIGAFLIGNIRSYYQIQHHNKSTRILYNKTVNIIGSVSDYVYIPDARMKYCITLSSIKIRTNETQTWTHLNKTLKIYTARPQNLQVADVIKLNDISIKEPKNESYKLYLIKEGIIGTIFTKNLNLHLISRPSLSVRRWIFNHKMRIYNSAKKKLSKQTFTLFSSLFLGNRTNCKKEMEVLNDQFRDWGILHYLARSGLHLVIFILLWQKILSFIPLPFVIKQLIMLVLGILYFIFSWPSISFIRAFIIFIFYRICIILKVRSNFLYLLTLVCLLTLLANPIQLLFLDFQLSFALTFALAWLGQSRNAFGQTKQ